MSSVTQRIGEIKQPYGGYIKPSIFELKQFNDNNILANEENIRSNLIGLTVDYLTRFMLCYNAKKAFSISLLGSTIIRKEQLAYALLNDIKGIDNKSIINACKLSGFDVCFRASVKNYKPIEEINPDEDTIKNIRIMVKRSLAFIKLYGPIIKDSFTFEGGYTSYIDTGDGDFLTKDTLWDFKVSKYEPKSKYTLQLLVYYLMGMHSIHSEFENITKLGIFNPRLNKVYTLSIGLIPIDIMDVVEKEVIGYGILRKQIPIMTTFKDIVQIQHRPEKYTHSPKEKVIIKVDDTKVSELNDPIIDESKLKRIKNEKELTVAEISKYIKVSKGVIYKWIRSGDLYAEKRKNKYYIKSCDLESFLQRKRQREFIIICVFLTALLIFFFYTWLIIK